MVKNQSTASDTTSSRQKVFIVGGTGMLGKSAVAHFVKKRYEVTSISLPIGQDEAVIDSPDTSLHKNVEYIFKDVSQISDTEMLRIMKGKDYMLITLGADERHAPKVPAIDFFRLYNVTYIMNLLRLARLAKIKKVVILGSYFTYFNRIWPELQLKKHHPYIRSRVEQMELAFSYSSNAMQVIILEIPYVFGTIHRGTPLWSIVSEQLQSNRHIYHPEGGTAMATQKEVAEAIEGAFLYGSGKKAYPVASVNLKWKTFMSHLLKMQNQEHKALTPYSNFATKREMRRKMKQLKKEKREGGLNLLEYLKFQERDAYLDVSESISNLRFRPDNLGRAIHQTVLACQNQIQKYISKED